jgi:hypothetical protein
MDAAWLAIVHTVKLLFSMHCVLCLRTLDLGGEDLQETHHEQQTCNIDFNGDRASGFVVIS